MTTVRLNNQSPTVVLWCLRTCLAVSFLTILTSNTQAYCIGGDTCPSATSGVEVFQICGNASSSSCTGTLDVSGANEITFGRILTGSYPLFVYQMAACIKNGGSGAVHRLRHSSYRGGGMVIWSSPQVDVAFCAGAGNDILRVQSSTSSCGGVNFYAWSYGANYETSLWGQSDRDSIAGGSGNDRICGGTGDDNLTVSGPLTGLWGSSGADDIDGWTGNDQADAYSGSGDQVWGYDGTDIVQDLIGSSGGDAVYGEDDTDTCVYIDEAVGTWEINGGRATCDPPSCSCGTTDDDSCYDRTLNSLSMTIGVEISDNVFNTYCTLD